MDPELLDKLKASGGITQDTYNAAMNGNASVDPGQANQSVAPPPTQSTPADAPAFGPPTPTAEQLPLSGGTSQATAPAPTMSSASTPPPNSGEQIGPPSPVKSSPLPNYAIDPGPAQMGQKPVYSTGAPATPQPRSLTSAELGEKQLEGRIETERTRGDETYNAHKLAADAESAGADKMGFMINQELSDQQKISQRRDAHFLESNKLANDTLDNLNARYRALGDTKIDPDNKWKSMSAGGKFATTLSLALGGIGGRGQGNVGLDMWNKKINDDIDAQKTNLANGYHGLDAESNIAAKKYALAGDVQGWYGAKQLEGWTNLSHRVDAVAQETKSDTVKAQLGLVKVGIDRKVDEQKQNLEKYHFDMLQGRERAAAQAAAAAQARYAAQQKDQREKSWALQQNGTPVDEADRLAARNVYGVDINPEAGPMGHIPSKEEREAQFPKQSAEAKLGKEKDFGERTVVIDGKDALATNKDAAEKWRHYIDAREIVSANVKEMARARKAGDVGAYNQARKIVMETTPEVLGYNRAPSEGQLNHTLNEDVIPEYNHWYDKDNLTGAGLGLGVGGYVSWKVKEGRAQEKMKGLESLLAIKDKSMREQTFGANQAPAAQGEKKVDLNSIDWTKGK